MEKDIFKRFISLEGGEGAGKTTVSKEIKKELENKGYLVHLTREPGGSDVAESIRNIIMKNELDVETEALLFAAARLNHVHNVIIPKLKEGYFVICDRYVDSSIVYQEIVGKCENVKKYNKCVLENYLPSKTFFFDIKAEDGIRRVLENDREQNRFDKRKIDFHKAIYNAYKIWNEDKKRIINIDATKDVLSIKDEIIKNLEI